MMSDEVRGHCHQIDRCNQRGGRMLSIVDLLDAQTLDADLAAYCLAAIGRGASFLVGAVPGGAGKTTVMGALLNFVPPGVELAPADGMAAIRRGAGNADPRRCYICHEIGPGSYYAYLWGEELRAYLDLPAAGHMVATNLHADTYAQVHEQICTRNGVSEAALRRMNLMLFLSARRRGLGLRRRIEQVWESDGHAEHRLVFAVDASTSPAESSRLVSGADIAGARKSIDGLVDSGARGIEEVRAAILAGCA